MTPYKQAMDAFMDSIEGKRCADIRSLGGPAGMQFYLESRLKSAFEAGWNARGETTMRRANRATSIECTCRAGLPRCAAPVHRDSVPTRAPTDD